jgi:hypothetical protein
MKLDTFTPSVVTQAELEGLTPAAREDLEEKKRYYTKQIIDCYSTVMPYEMAKMQAITISGGAARCCRNA